MSIPAFAKNQLDYQSVRDRAKHDTFSKKFNQSHERKNTRQ
jgi:hypothetical protein